MKKIALITLSLLALAGCAKIEKDQADIIGEWTETYAEYPYYAEEGFVTWDFKADGNVDIHVYDVFAGDTYKTTVYELVHPGEGGSVIIRFPSGEYTTDVQGYVIKKLTKTEMEWQKVGTTFQKGTVGSDFKHFTRK